MDFETNSRDGAVEAAVEATLDGGFYCVVFKDNKYIYSIHYLAS